MGLLKHEYDCCELTGSVQDLHLHHVIFRSQGGDDVRANVICITSNGHERYHAKDPVVMRLLAKHILDKRPDTLAYLRTKLKSEEATQLWFEKHGLTDGV